MSANAEQVRSAQVTLWSAALALLRGDRQGAVLLVDDSNDPAMATAASEALAEVLRMYSVGASNPRQVQQYAVDTLHRLTMEATPVEGGV